MPTATVPTKPEAIPGAEFFAPVASSSTGGVNIPALVCDTYEGRQGDPVRLCIQQKAIEMLDASSLEGLAFGEGWEVIEITYEKEVINHYVLPPSIGFVLLNQPNTWDWVLDKTKKRGEGIRRSQKGDVLSSTGLVSISRALLALVGPNGVVLKDDGSPLVVGLKLQSMIGRIVGDNSADFGRERNEGRGTFHAMNAKLCQAFGADPKQNWVTHLGQFKLKPSIQLFKGKTQQRWSAGYEIASTPVVLPQQYWAIMRDLVLSESFQLLAADPYGVELGKVQQQFAQPVQQQGDGIPF